MNRLSTIRKMIDRADDAYFNTGKPILEDEQYDALKKELRTLCAGDERFGRVGFKPRKDSMLKKYQHTVPMTSLRKADNADELRFWYNSTVNDQPEHRHKLLVALKADGATMVLHYKNGELERAVTRGGDEGLAEDITANAIHMIGVPTSVSTQSSFMVRGECILTIERWLKLDPNKESNPRNLGNGMMRRLDGQNSELLEFLAFDIEPIAPSSALPDEIITESQKMALLTKLGFNTITATEVDNIEIGIKLFNQIAKERDSLPYWIDGVVFKIHDVAFAKSLGVVGNRPHAHAVLKFEAEGEITTLERVELTVGHTGAIIPTGKVTPIRIGGTTISSVLLNNFDEIQALDLAIGDQVKIIKAKDIIPKCVAVVRKGDNRQPIIPPTKCPVCDGTVARRINIAKGSKAGEEGVVIECKNDDCPAQSIARLKTWIKKLDIQGIGDEVLAALMSDINPPAYAVRTPADLYRIATNPTKMAFLPSLPVGKGKLGMNRAANIIKQIKEKQNISLNLFLGSLGIPHLGRRRAEMVMEAVPGEFNNLEDWLDSDKLLKFAEQAGIKNMAAAIVNGIVAFRDEIDELLPFITFVEVRPVALPLSGDEKEAPEGQKAGIFTGCVFCFTGKIEKIDESGKRYTRDRMAKLVIENGGQVLDDVRAGVTHLVQADVNSVSTKSQKAKKLGVSMMSESEFFTTVGL